MCGCPDFIPALTLWWLGYAPASRWPWIGHTVKKVDWLILPPIPFWQSKWYENWKPQELGTTSFISFAPNLTEVWVCDDTGKSLMQALYLTALFPSSYMPTINWKPHFLKREEYSCNLEERLVNKSLTHIKEYITILSSAFSSYFRPLNFFFFSPKAEMLSQIWSVLRC